MAKRNTGNTRVSLFLPDQMILEIRRRADAQRRPFASLVREALEDYYGVEDTVRVGIAPKTERAITQN
jgi:hypothetical protein